MKIYTLLFIGLISCIISYAQNEYYQGNKYDRYSIFGSGGWGNAVLSIDQDSINIIHVKGSDNLYLDITASTMSDENGNLMFYTNGIHIYNKNHSLMQNGNRIYRGSFLDIYHFNEWGLPTIQGAISLPSPTNDSICYLINVDIDIKYYTNPVFAWGYSPELYYQKIDMSKENGLGAVIEKNKIITENIEEGNITACRHANGRDWWILVNEFRSNIYQRFLLDGNGIKLDGKQQLNDIPVERESFVRISNFTQNGKKFVRVNDDTIPLVYIMDFDRCSGSIGKIQKIKVNANKSNFIGAAISSNSRFLYINKNDFILQYDLEAEDIESSMDTVAVYDGFFSSVTGCRTTFYQSWLAPDGKIYISCAPCASEYLHVIDKPDIKGKECSVKQHKIKLPVVNAYTAQNFPNYRLGPLKGSPCDTIVAIHEITKEDYHIKVFPNPATTELKIDITLPRYDAQTATEIRLVSSAGAIVKTYIMPDFAYIASLDISDIESGFYEVQLRQLGKTMAVEKVVVIR